MITYFSRWSKWEKFMSWRLCVQDLAIAQGYWRTLLPPWMRRLRFVSPTIARQFNATVRYICLLYTSSKLYTRLVKNEDENMIISNVKNTVLDVV